jgi:hypothetical protein
MIRIPEAKAPVGSVVSYGFGYLGRTAKVP